MANRSTFRENPGAYAGGARSLEIFAYGYPIGKSGPACRRGPVDPLLLYHKSGRLSIGIFNKKIAQLRAIFGNHFVHFVEGQMLVATPTSHVSTLADVTIGTNAGLWSVYCIMWIADTVRTNATLTSHKLSPPVCLSIRCSTVR